MQSQDLKKYKLPNTPGVYFFLGKKDKQKKTILYIGKAGSLRQRVKSYFSKDIEKTRGPLIVQMLEKAEKIDFIKTDSVLEALILEASLIKKYKPKYNTKEKDDKSHNFIVITKEDFPRILVLRGRELEKKTKDYKLQAKFGPFPQGSILKEAMKIIRKIFPFRDKCTPPKINGLNSSKRCFNRQIELCPGVCSGEISKKEYAKIISNIKMFLSGKKNTLIKKLEREMNVYAKKQKFEKALKNKKTIFALKHIQDVSLIKENYKVGNRVSNFVRIEGYDVAHISGKYMVGVMVVMNDNAVDKSQYRKFKIKSVFGANDTASLKEILKRRFSHHEWRYPDLIVIDGGQAQKNIAEKVLKELDLNIPVVSVVKDEKHKPKNILGDKKIVNTNKKDILLVNFESHRFAINYHRNLRSKLFKI